VTDAARSVLGNALDVTHAMLEISADLLQLAPVPGLAEAARALLGIWDALQAVDMNRMACLRLTERCADVLWSVREEVRAAGDETGEELREPVARLVEAFEGVRAVLVKQAHRPFLKRYLRRDEILRELAGCDNALGDAMSLFGVRVLCLFSIRMLVLMSHLNSYRYRFASSSKSKRTSVRGRQRMQR
jgi:abelson tyrosine-protein kinase 1